MKREAVEKFQKDLQKLYEKHGLSVGADYDGNLYVKEDMFLPNLVEGFDREERAKKEAAQREEERRIRYAICEADGHKWGEWVHHSNSSIGPYESRSCKVCYRREQKTP
jgi:hypothetical protein